MKSVRSGAEVLRAVNVYVFSLLFLKLIVVERGLAYSCTREGAVWSWQSFVDQSPEHRAVGRRRIGHSSVSTKFCAQLDEPCKTGEKRKEVNGWSSK